AVKVSLPLLVAFLIGIVEIFRRRGFYPNSRGYLFLRLMLVFWLFPMSIIGTKFLRYSLSLMPLVCLTSAVGIVVVWKGLTSWMRSLSVSLLASRRLATVLAGLMFLVAPGVSAARAVVFSHPALFVNTAGLARLGYFFPHDEFYDLSARESIRFEADPAPASARLASEIRGVVEYYLEKFGRGDIRSEIISQPGFSIEKAPDYVLLQPGRQYIENLDTFSRIESDWQIVQTSEY